MLTLNAIKRWNLIMYCDETHSFRKHFTFGWFQTKAEMYGSVRSCSLELIICVCLLPSSGHNEELRQISRLPGIILMFYNSLN